MLIYLCNQKMKDCLQRNKTFEDDSKEKNSMARTEKVHMDKQY